MDIRTCFSVHFVTLGLICSMWIDLSDKLAFTRSRVLNSFLLVSICKGVIF